MSQGGLGSFRVLDNLAKGLGELGHQVFYQLPAGTDEPLPLNVTLVAEQVRDVDIHHVQSRDLWDDMSDISSPWVRTCHVDVTVRGLDRSCVPVTDHWVFVSQTLAAAYGKRRFVRNGIDPAEFIYSQTKHDYLLFMCQLDRALQKGLDIALALSRATGFCLWVAGSAIDPEIMNMVSQKCQGHNVRLLGEVRGVEKAEVLAGARALLFPTQLNETFGLVMAEALISGTPVISSSCGACPEIISPDVGFVCRSEEEYKAAISRIDEISPVACRDKAMKEYHYLRMAGNYVREYENEIALSRAGERLTAK